MIGSNDQCVWWNKMAILEAFYDYYNIYNIDSDLLSTIYNS